MSAALMILPVVWATASPSRVKTRPEEMEPKTTAPELAFYRKYTEGMLRRYVRLSMEAGRAPSLLGREMFRGRVTSYRVHSFEDVVIFVHDVEACLKRLNEGQQHLIRRIALQEFTQAETAGLLGLSLRSVHRRYANALDQLTEIFLERKLLEPLKACQEAGAVL
ncbi:sigma factor-like helix-turn-helix DNA-binding protein [Granulicella sp. S190]|uniref:sigma factor-like helix-turn-helix DNA-binding protein n=1 Tax=Granulicella sp. S190 TaxID=1747226 RepID=UPI00131C33D0|nr:sigma factor-like helix-turn-helix DNA-binding protein [Granulicella sp. S190]